MASPVHLGVKKQKTVLFYVCKACSWQDVQRHLSDDEQLLWRDPKGHSCLHFACMGNNFDVAYNLSLSARDKYRDMLRQGTTKGETPFQMACRLGHLNLVNLFTYELNVLGVDFINTKDDSGEAPLHVACLDGHAALAQHLLDNGADVNGKNGGGSCPIHIAVEAKNQRLLELLLERPELLIDETDAIGCSALHRACGFDEPWLLDLLLSRGASIHPVDSARFTPLHSACTLGFEATVKRLLVAGAEVNDVTRNGESALYLASDCGHSAIVRLLLDHGAKVYMANTLDPVHIAKLGRQERVIHVLTDHLRGVSSGRGLSATLVSCLATQISHVMPVRI